jgi:hypothetical protein
MKTRLFPRISSSSWRTAMLSRPAAPRVNPWRRFVARLGFVGAGVLLAYSPAAAAPGDIYVSDYTAQTISIVSSGNAALFVRQNAKDGNPQGLAFDAKGNLYVADSPSKIIRYTSGGAASVFAGAGTGLDEPFGLAFDSKGDLYVANSEADNILRYTPAGDVSVFADSGKGVSAPLGIAFDSSDNLYVANLGFQNVLRITPDGVSTVFAAEGVKGIEYPFGVAVDSSDRIYVASGSDIVRFTSRGSGSIFADKGLDQPQALAITGAGDVYATNEQGFVESYSPGGSPSLFYQFSGGYPVGIAIEPASATKSTVPVLSVVAKGAATAVEGDTDGVFVISRSTGTAKELPVRFSLTGTAKNGVEYDKISRPLVIPKGAGEVKIKVVPIGEQAKTGLHTVILKLLASSDGAYTLGTDKKATITIEPKQ